MAPRVRTSDLRERLDALALAFLAVTDAMLGVLADVHPDREDVWERIRDDALGLVVELSMSEQDVFEPAAIERAKLVVLMVMAARMGGPIAAANDDGE